MRRLVLRLIINALALYVAVQVVPGLYAVQSWVTFAAMALILGVLNALIRPVLAILTGPLIILTLGLFLLILNALMLWLAGVIGTALGLGFEVTGFVPAFWGALVVSLVNWGLTLLIGDHKKSK